MADISEYSPSSGKVLKDDSTTVNIADLIESLSTDVSDLTTEVSNLNTLLTAAVNNDKVDTNLKSVAKGNTTTALSAVSATTLSSSIDCTGFTSVLVAIVCNDSGVWNVALTGSPIDEGIFLPLYDGAYKLETGNISDARIMLFRGIPDFLKVIATLISGAGTCDVIVQPLN